MTDIEDYVLMFLQSPSLIKPGIRDFLHLKSREIIATFRHFDNLHFGKFSRLQYLVVSLNSTNV